VGCAGGVGFEGALIIMTSNVTQDLERHLDEVPLFDLGRRWVLPSRPLPRYT
jgi:hypothetical protein